MLSELSRCCMPLSVHRSYRGADLKTHFCYQLYACGKYYDFTRWDVRRVGQVLSIFYLLFLCFLFFKTCQKPWDLSNCAPQISANERPVKLRISLWTCHLYLWWTNSALSRVTDHVVCQQMSTRGSDVQRLKDAGIPVRHDNSRYYMHHKFCIFDEKLLANGSFNWSRQAVMYNYENIVIYDDRELVCHSMIKLFSACRLSSHEEPSFQDCLVNAVQRCAAIALHQKKCMNWRSSALGCCIDLLYHAGKNGALERQHLLLVATLSVAFHKDCHYLEIVASWCVVLWKSSPWASVTQRR